jgi:hypothetical protein
MLIANKFMKLLDEAFGKRVISKGIWSQDRQILHHQISFWGAAKVKVYEYNPHMADKLKTAVIQITHSIM